MRKFGKLALGAVAILALGFSAQPLFAACGGAPIMTTYDLASTDVSLIWSAGSVWETDFPGSGQCLGYGCYGDPLNDDLQGYFWSLGTGDPAIGPGDDNGSFPVDQWVSNESYLNAGTYFYPALINGNAWILATDGCVFNQTGTPGGNCTCLLLSDTWGGQTYFALMAAQDDGIGNTTFFQPGSAPLVLRPLPKPEIVNSVRLPNLDVDLTVRVSSPSAGVYQKDGCDCGPLSYKLYEQILPRGSAAPDSRDVSGWTEVGGTTIDGTTTYTSACGGADTDVWLAAGITWDSDFETTLVSGNATRVECGPNIANPDELQRRPVQLPSREGAKRGR